MEDESLKKKIMRGISNRVLIFSVMVCFMFYALAAKLFNLQIVNGEAIERSITATKIESMVMPAPRGTIYDKFGRPLAVNESAFTIKINPAAQVENWNETFYSLVGIFEKNGEEYVDEFPISKDKPYIFLFNGSDTKKERWLEDMTIPLRVPLTEAKLKEQGKSTDIQKNEKTDNNKTDEQKKKEQDEKTRPITATEAFTHLREQFKIPKYMTDEQARKILNFRSMVYMHRYHQYDPITIAYSVSDETVVNIEENSDKYMGVFVDVDSLRKYPGGKYASHIVGYIGRVTQEELETNKDKGYQQSDVIGKTGLEASFEGNLKGISGEQLVEVNSHGRPVKSLDPVPPVPGDKIFTSIDLEFQKKCYDILENQLKSTLKNKITGKYARETPITLDAIFSSMVKNNNIPVKDIMASKEGDYAFDIKQHVLEVKPDAKTEASEDVSEVKKIVMEAIHKNLFTESQMLIVMKELGIISGDDVFVEKLKSGKVSPMKAVLNKIDEGEITPQMVNLDPSSGSIVVVDVETGDVLSAVNYPTYDSNNYVNNRNNEYIEKINKDPTSPQINRAFAERRAPGSTFKMISAVTGLEKGVITPRTRIYDELIFTKAKQPFAKCYSHISHGNITVEHALEVSCNYFFSEMAFDMGNSKEGTDLVSIKALNEYMIAFGLNNRSGVEIGEARDTFPDELLTVSSPEYKAYNAKQNFKEPTPNQLTWFDGDTVRTAFGQAENSYTPAVMAKYIATLAADGVRRQLHLVNKVEKYDGNLIKKTEPNVETVVSMKPETLKTVHKGMLLVTEGSKGTARSVFKDFPIKVAGKTGTAQEIRMRNGHSSFGGFAPFEDPQIAVYVMIPFGDTKAMPASAAQVARDVIEEYFNLNNEPEREPKFNSLSK